jgi:autotransporter family porin
MNTIYRLVWNRILGVFVVASELAHRGHAGRSTPLPATLSARRRLYCALVLAGLVSVAHAQTTATLSAYDPQINDQLVGAQAVGDGSVLTLTGPQRFLAGDDGTRQTSLGALQANGRVLSGLEWVGAPRLNPGSQNFGVTIPDPITGGKRVTSTFATANLTDLAPTSLATTVPDVVNVNGAQYINARVGTVTDGGMHVNIGTPGALSTASTNGWTMAAKQSTLFLADSTTSGAASAIDWQSNNRITFTGTAAAPTVPQNFNSTYVSTYGGTFSVTTLDGVTTSHTVNNAADLRAYNDFLIAQLQSGNLDPTQYNAQFNKAYSSATKTTTYTITADVPADEVAQAIGDRIVMRASGAGAAATIDAGARLEVVNSNHGAVRAEGGGTATNNGTLATTHSTGDGIAMLLTGGSRGSNTGVINGNFFLAANGSTTDSPYGSNVVEVLAGSTFDNSGIINFATGSTNGAGHSSGIHLSTGATGSNSGTVNVGVTGSKSNGSMDGVLLDDPTANFTNTSTGTIYIGRGPQTAAGMPGAEVALNQQALTAGINVSGNGMAINAGHITIGSKAQNAAAILVSGGANAAVTNSGTIDINGKAATVPRENIGISVLNSGSGGGISNTGTINLNGVNGTGIKIISTGATASSASSTGTINVAGGADPASGTRNFGVWVEGQGSATSTADIGGPVNLLGDGAIGIHARGKATVNVAATAIPTFASGSKQIAFFAYGPDAKINVASSTLNVTTDGSDLFRLENGADFDGTGLTLTASGANSVAVLGTGASSTLIDTKDANINVNGAGATGVIAEGGATGTIDAATTMQLTGVGAVAAIVDGQKHSLTGAATGSPVATTTLASAATLSSATDGLTGYIARNSAKLTNTGDITFTGAHATGIRVESGATATNSGDIAVTNGGTGILVDSAGATAATTANTTGSIAVNGGSVADRTRGVVASGTKSVVNLLDGAQVLLNGTGAIGAEAVSAGLVNVAASATPVFGNTDQIAFHAVGAGAKIASAAAALDASTARSTIYRIDDGAALSLSGTPTLTASGAGSRAIVGSGADTAVASGAATVVVGGANAAAMEIRGGASGSFGAASGVNLSGANTIGGIADGQKLDLAGNPFGAPVATVLTNGATIAGSGAGTTGLIARNLGTVVNNGSVDLTGADATGVLVQAGGALVNNGTVHVANGTGVRVEGAGEQTLSPGGAITVDNGIAGVRLLDGAQLTLSGANTTITAGGTAHGILVDSGAAGLTANDATIDITGNGNGIENAAELSGIDLNGVTINVADGAGIRTATALDPSSTVTFNVSGSGVGFAYRKADGSPGSDDLAYGPGYVANVNGIGGIGIQALTTGTIDSQATVNVTGASGGVALLAGTAASSINSGTLTSMSTAAPVVDLSNGNGTRFTNTGTLSASSPAAVAVRGSAGNDIVTLADGALRGDIATGGGSDQFDWTAGTLDGGLTMGNGANNVATLQNVDTTTAYHLLAGTGGGNALNFDGTQARGGSFAMDDPGKGINLGTGWNTINFSNGTSFTLTDNVRLANSDVNIDASSTLFAGDNVHPVISGASAGYAHVSNAGLIDLTNGDGSPGNALTIDGDYISQAGQLALITTLNGGGALSNQFTDRLLVRGNVSEPGGATVLNITPGALSDGALSDFNHNSAVDANEGISVVQVAGTSSADAFRLNGGSVAAGPFQYGLYAFQPGASQAAQRAVGGATAGNRFWDYRLANVYICESDCTPMTAVNPSANPSPSAPAPAPLPPPNPATPPLPPPLSPQVAALDGCVVDGVDNCAPGRREVTPQVPAYISAPMALASYGYEILDNLHKRLGEVRHESTLDAGLGGEAFARYIGGDYHYNTDRSFRQYGYDFEEEINALQVGANVFGIDTDKSTMRGGVAFTHGTTRIDPHAADGFSRTKYYSNSIAMFLTWQDVNGFYVDGVVSGDRHQGDVDIGGGSDVARIRASGWTASIETGYPWRFDNGMELEPQLQISRQDLKVHDFTDLAGASVRYNYYDQNIGRLGVRLTHTWQSDSGRQGTPYLRLNYIQGWGGNRPRVTVGDDSLGISQAFTGGSYGRALELGLGGTMTFGNRISLYGEGDYQKNLGDAGLRGWGFNLGARWMF